VKESAAVTGRQGYPVGLFDGGESPWYFYRVLKAGRCDTGLVLVAVLVVHDKADYIQDLEEACQWKNQCMSDITGTYLELKTIERSSFFVS